MKKKVKKILTILLCMCLIMCPVNLQASEQSAQDSVVLIGIVEKDSEEIAGIVTGVVVEKNGLSWVITASEVASFSLSDYAFVMITNKKENSEVYPFVDSGSNIAIFYGKASMNIPALPLGSELDVNHELCYITPSESQGEEIIYHVDYLDDFTKAGSVYQVNNLEDFSSMWVGSPIIDLDTAAVTGIGSVNDNGGTFKDATSDTLYEEYALENWGRAGEDSGSNEKKNQKEETNPASSGKEQDVPSEEPVKAEEETDAAEPEEVNGGESEKKETVEGEKQETEQSEGENEEKESGSEPSSVILDDDNAKWFLGLIAVGIILVIMMKRKKTNKKSGSGSSEDSYSIDLSGMEEEKRAADKVYENYLNATESYETCGKNYYLEGLNGTFAGSRFPVNGILKIGRDPQTCNVLYPPETKGISRNHCTVEVRDGKIYIRDLESSYGTYFQNGDRLNGQVSYQVQPGTIFYLAETKNMFRVIE